MTRVTCTRNLIFLWHIKTDYIQYMVPAANLMYVTYKLQLHSVMLACKVLVPVSATRHKMASF